MEKINRVFTTCSEITWKEMSFFNNYVDMCVKAYIPRYLDGDLNASCLRYLNDSLLAFKKMMPKNLFEIEYKYFSSGVKAIVRFKEIQKHQFTVLNFYYHF